MANRKSTAQGISVQSTQATSDITYGLAQMENHWRAEDGLLLACPKTPTSKLPVSA